NPAPSPVATMTKDQLNMAFTSRIDAVNKLLLLNSPLYVLLMGVIKKKLNLLPPSAAMAGIYTMVDNTRGVWKAPANVSLNSVVS
ncbi:phage tail sheath family protein, partial [Undibacterium sp. SXout7W]